jgi:hypothetical protein
MLPDISTRPSDALAPHSFPFEPHHDCGEFKDSALVTGYGDGDIFQGAWIVFRATNVVDPPQSKQRVRHRRARAGIRQFDE